MKKEAKAKRKIVEEAPDWLLVVRKFIRMANKENSQTVLRRLLKEIQTKFAAKKNKTTPYISLIRRMQDTVVEQANKNTDKKSFELKVPKMFVSLLKQASATIIVSKTKNTKLKGKSLSGIKKKAKPKKRNKK